MIAVRLLSVLRLLLPDSGFMLISSISATTSMKVRPVPSKSVSHSKTSARSSSSMSFISSVYALLSVSTLASVCRAGHNAMAKQSPFRSFINACR